MTLPSRRQAFAGALLALPSVPALARGQDRPGRSELERLVAAAIGPHMARHDIPGMGVALTVRGVRHDFSFGRVSPASGQPVTRDTLFEIGSVSKAFTATLAGWAEARGVLSLDDAASRHWPVLAGTSLGRTSLLDLGTYTAGGLPLQFPGAVTDEAKMLAFLRRWRPDYPAGTRRRYSNPSIGLFGLLAARSLGRPFADLMEEEIFPALGLAGSFIRVPRRRMGDYAFGTSRENGPIRVNPGVLAAEAYGVKTSAAELIRFVEAIMSPAALVAEVQRAVAITRTGYYRVGEMVQGLGWEMYAYPTPLDRLLAGNAPEMAFNAHDAIRLNPPHPPGANLLINKTGSTNGFGAYVAFVPAKAIGIAMLANRNTPTSERVRTAHAILTALDA